MVSNGGLAEITLRVKDGGGHATFFAERFLGLLKLERFVVCGSPSPEVREALAGFAPVYMQAAGGFTRQS